MYEYIDAPVCDIIMLPADELDESNDVPVRNMVLLDRAHFMPKEVQPGKYMILLEHLSCLMNQVCS